MDNITYDENGERVLQGCPRKCKQIGKTDHHSGNCICHKGNTFNRTFDLTADRASGCHKSRPIGEQRPCKSRDHCHHKRVGVYAEQGIVLKHCTDMLHCKGYPVGPFIHKRNHKHHCKDREDAEQDHSAEYRKHSIPLSSFFQFNRRNFVVSHIIFLQDMKHCNTYDRGNYHNQSHNRSIPEVRDTSQHLRIEHAGDHLKLSAHRCRDAKIRKAKEKGLYERRRQSSQKGRQDRHAESLQRGIPHQAGNDHEPLVDIAHRIVEEHKRNRQGIDHITQKEAIKSVYIKQLCPKELRQKPLVSKGINNGKSICNGWQQHRQHSCLFDEVFIPPPQIGIMDRVSQYKCQQCGNQRAAHRYQKAVAQRLQESFAAQHLCVVGKRNPVLPVHRKGLPQHHDHWQRQKDGKKDCQQDKNHFNLSVLSHRSLLFSRPASVPASARKTEYRYYFSLSPADSG